MTRLRRAVLLLLAAGLAASCSTYHLGDRTVANGTGGTGGASTGATTGAASAIVDTSKGASAPDAVPGLPLPPGITASLASGMGCVLK